MTSSRPAGDGDSFAERVYALVRQVPPGRVVSYGGIAALLGYPRAARAVGAALRALQEGTTVPWWRVLNRDGAISLAKFDPHGARLQRTLLEREGVVFDGSDRVDWDRFGWSGPEPGATDPS